MRLAELVATLSLGADLGLGQPMEHVIRECLIALRLSERLGLNEAERGAVYYGALLAWVGCHTDAYEQAKWFGDDIALKRNAQLVDGGGFGTLASHLGAGKPFHERARLAIAFPGGGLRAVISMLKNHWLATDAMAVRLGLGDSVRSTLKQSFERWDGKGAFGLKGEEIALTSRLVSLADVVEVFQRTGGVESAVSVAQERSRTRTRSQRTLAQRSGKHPMTGRLAFRRLAASKQANEEEEEEEEVDMATTEQDAPRVGEYVDAGGVHTYYEVAGTGEPLILLHGGFCTVETFGAQTPALAEQYQIYVPERRGHGRTPMSKVRSPTRTWRRIRSRSWRRLASPRHIWWDGATGQWWACSWRSNVLTSRESSC